MSFLKKVFAKKDHLQKSYEKVYALSDYDDTYKDIMAVFKLVGLRMTRNDSPSARYWWNVFYWFEFVTILMGLVLEVVEAVITGKGGSFEDAVAIFRMLPCISFLILANLKSYKMICNRPIFENLTKELRTMWPDGAVSDDEHRVLNNALKELKYIIKAYCWCNYFLILSYLLPCYVDIIRRAFGQDVLRMLPFFFWLPFDPLKPGIFEVVLVLQSWQTILTVCFMLCADVLFCIYLSHITTQLNLLSLRILRLVYVPVDNQLISVYPLGSNVVGNRDEQEQLNMITWESRHHNELVSILKRHTDLIRLSNDVEDMFSFGLFINFLMTSIIICFCGFCCVLVEKWNEITYKVFLITDLSQTWLICWYGQKLLDSSTGIADALYSSGWYRASKKVRSTMFIMMQRSSKDVHVTTYGFSTICLASFATIIKTAWSYFTLLLNTYHQ